MRGLLGIAFALAAGLSCVQAAKENIDTNSKGLAKRCQPPQWNQNSDKIVEHLASILTDFLGVDGNGNRINLKTDEELQSMAHLIGATLKEQKCDPCKNGYIDAAVEGGFVFVFCGRDLNVL